MSDSSLQWWKQTDILGALNSRLAELKPAYDIRCAQQTRMVRLYGRLPLGVGKTFDRTVIPRSQMSMVSDRVTFNVISPIVDTALSRLIQHRPSIRFLTDGDDFFESRKAKKLTAFLEGAFHELDVGRIARQIRCDAAVLGTGIAYVFFGPDNELACERVPFSEIMVDEEAALWNPIREIHRVKRATRGGLADLFPDFVDKFESAKETSDGLIETHDSYTLDGKRHIIAIEDCVLLDEEWNSPRLPFVFMPFYERHCGPWGIGVPELLRDIQIHVNQLLYVITRALQVGASFRLLIPSGSKVQRATNQLGEELEYTGGVPPSYLVPPRLLPSELYEQLERLEAKAYELVGISKQAAMALKPQGVEAAVAIRAVVDRENDRSAEIEAHDTQFHLDLADRIMDVARENKSFKVRLPGARGWTSISSSELNFREDGYRLQALPTSQLPKDVSGRLQAVSELEQGGYLSKEEALKLLDFPDLTKFTDERLAGEEYVEKVIALAIDEGKITQLQPDDNFQLLGSKITQYLDLVKLHNEDGELDDQLEALRSLQDQVASFIAAAAPAPAAPMPGQGAPLVPPGPEMVPATFPGSGPVLSNG